jgi:hypothetical protein
MGGRGYVAFGLAVLVLVVLPLALAAPALWEDPIDGGAAARPSDVDAAPAVSPALTCVGRARPADAADVAPDRVVAARLCATDNGLSQWYAPQDSLHADLGPLVRGLAVLQPMPESTDDQRYFCPDDGGDGFDLLLALDSGEVVSIPGDTGGCSTVRIGGKDVVGSDGVLTTFLASLADQRAGSDPAGALQTLPLGCGSDGPFGDHVVSRIGDPRDLMSAVSCWRPDSKHDIGPWRGPTALTDGEVARLVADMRDHARRDLGWHYEPCRDRPRIHQDLVGQTRWGDVVVVRGVCRTYLLSDVSSVAPEDQAFWYPSPAAQRILDGLRD